MIDLKTVVGGFAIAGSIALAIGGFGTAMANADPSTLPPHVTTPQDDGGPAPSTPSPYAAYGGAGICATPGLYFVNVCT